MAADCLSLQHVSLLVDSVGGRFRTLMQPWRWRRSKFCAWYLFFSFTCVIWASSVLLPELHRGKTMSADCWFSLRNVDAEAAKQMKLSPSSPKNINFPSRLLKPLAWQEVQLPYVSCWYVPRPRPTGIRNFWSNEQFNLFRFLSGIKVQFHLSRKNYWKFHSNGKRSESKALQQSCIVKIRVLFFHFNFVKKRK